MPMIWAFLEEVPIQKRAPDRSWIGPRQSNGHLFPRGDDGAELAAAEKALLPVAS
jgi:hypothetical protein